MINELLIKKVDEYLKNEKFISYGERYFKTNNLKLHPFDDFKLSSWDNWEVDPFKNRSWQWKLNWFSFVPYFLAYYHSTKDDKVLDEIKISINSWLNQYIDKDTSSFEFVWHDHAMALRAEQMVFFYVYTLNYSKKWFEENNTFIEYMLSGIKKHALLLSKDEYFTKYTNHGLEQARVLLILGLFLDDIESEKYQKLAISRIKDELLFAFTNEGVHVENSPAYHIFVLKVFMGIIKDFPKELLGDLSEQFDGIATKALSFITHIIRPDGTLPPIGDTEQLKTSDAYSLIYSNTQEYKELLYALTQGKKGIKPKKLNQVYKNSGYAIFRDQWFDEKNYKQALHLIAKIGCLSQYHNQQDEGHISLYAFGEDWLIDSGMYNHNNTDSIRKYMRSRLAHNVPLISNTKYDSDFSHRVNNWEVIDFSEDENNPNVKIKLKVLENVIHNRNINLHTQDKVINIDDIFEFEDNQSRDITLQWHIPVDKTITISESLNQVSIVSKTGNTLILDIIGDNPDKIYIQKGINKDKVLSVISHKSNSYVDSQVLKILFAKKSFLKVSSKFTFTSNLQNIQKDEVVVQEKPIKVFIFGSCVSRDPFEIEFAKNNFEVVQYFARSSFASLGAKPFVDNKIIENIESNFQKRSVLQDMDKSLFKQIQNRYFDIFLIDLIDERFNLALYEDSIHTISSEYKKALYKPNKYSTIDKFSDEKYRLWEIGFKKFVNYIKDNNLEDKLILNKVFWTNRIDNKSLLETYSEEYIHNANKSLEKMYAFIEKIFPNIKEITYSNNIVYIDSNHKWGIQPFHFNNQMFEYQIRFLLENISNNQFNKKRFIANHYNNLEYNKDKNISYYFKNSNSNNLLVTFHGAIQPITKENSGTELPVFRLYDLQIDNQPSILCFSDALLDSYKKNGLFLGWFLDTKHISQREGIEYIIREYQKKYKYKRIVFHGTSGGGHIAVDMASRFNEIALISNCQFDLELHPQYEDLLNICKKVNDEIIDNKIENFFSKSKLPKKIIAYSNIKDSTYKHHKYLENTINIYDKNIFEGIYFDGSEIANKKGVNNHKIQFPNRQTIHTTLNNFFNNKVDKSFRQSFLGKEFIKFDKDSLYKYFIDFKQILISEYHNKELILNILSKENLQELITFGELETKLDKYKIEIGFMSQSGIILNSMYISSTTLSFWLVGHLSYFFIILPSEKTIIKLRNFSDKEYINYLNILSSDMFNNLDNSIRINSKLVKRPLVYLSYGRPYHFFYDKMAYYYSYFKNSSIKIDVAITKSDTFFDFSILSKMEFINILIFDDLKKLNEYRKDNNRYLIRVMRHNIDDYINEYNHWTKKYNGVPHPEMYKIDNNDFVLWLGICAEKRPWIEQKEAIIEIIKEFKVLKPNLCVVLDGLTRSSYESREDFIVNSGEIDYAFAQEIKSIFVDTKMINSVGFSSGEKMHLADRVNFFITNYLTDSMYVSRFSQAFGVGYGAKVSHPRQHFHPNTMILPSVYVEDIVGKSDNWSKIGYSIKPKNIIEFSKKALKYFENIEKQKYIFDGKGFESKYIKEKRHYILKSTQEIYSYLTIGEKFISIPTNTRTSHKIEKKAKYLFRAEGFSKLGSIVYIIAYEDVEKIFTDKLAFSKSKYINFPENATHFRLFIRLKEKDEIEFYNIYWSTEKESSTPWFSIKYDEEFKNEEY